MSSRVRKERVYNFTNWTHKPWGSTWTVKNSQGVTQSGELKNAYFVSKGLIPGEKKARVKKVGNNGEKISNNTKVTGRRAFALHGTKRFKEKGQKSKGNPFGLGFLTSAPTQGPAAALYGMGGMINPAVIQAYSGSELETRGIESAVVAAGIHRVKYNRSTTVPGREIFSHTKRTFIFKARFSLDELKKDTMPGIPELLEACKKNANKAKGKDAVEPDVIEWYPEHNLVRIYECKIGLGKSEGFPGESFQLMKAKRVLELAWMSLPNKKNKPFPKIECYFLAWQFSQYSTVSAVPMKIEFAHHSNNFLPISKKLNERTPGCNKKQCWDHVEPINSTEFSKLTHLDSGIVTSQLESNRVQTIRNLQIVMRTYNRRHLGYTQAAKSRRNAQSSLERGWVSGNRTNAFIPTMSNTEINNRKAGRWAAVIDAWKNGPPKSQKEVAFNRAVFDRKWQRALKYLTKVKIIKLSEKDSQNTVVNKSTNSASNWNKERGPDGVVLHNESDLLEVLKRFMMYFKHPSKFGHDVKLRMSAWNATPVPGSLPRTVVEALKREFPGNEKWINSFYIETMLSPRNMATAAGSAQVKHLAANLKALSGSQGNVNIGGFSQNNS
jgi:hypothetical protein